MTLATEIIVATMPVLSSHVSWQVRRYSGPHSFLTFDMLLLDGLILLTSLLAPSFSFSSGESDDITNVAVWERATSHNCIRYS